MKLNAKVKQPNYKYLMVGGGVYAFEIVVIVVGQWLGASSLMAVSLSFWLGLVLSFVLQKLITFGDHRVRHRVLVPQLLAFSLLVAFNFGFTLLVTKILMNILQPLVTRTLALGITTIWNFYLYKTRIFKSANNAVY